MENIEFSVFVKNKYYDEIDWSNVILGLETLHELLSEFNVTNLRLSRTGDLADGLPREKLLGLLTKIFLTTPVEITLCHGLNTVFKLTDESSRTEIMKDAHNSLLGGHKRVSKNL